MAELRSLFESLGHSEVRTLIQSGNVIFASDQSVVSEDLEIAIAARFGIETMVVVLTSTEIKKVVKNNPFAGCESSKVHVGFMKRKPANNAVAGLDREHFLPEQFAVVGSELYLYLPDGMARTKLPDYLTGQLKVSITVRNWNTVNRLVDLAVN